MGKKLGINARKGFTNGQSWIATKEDCQRDWRCGKNGAFFVCFFCTHKFVPGDVVRWQYTNDVPGAGGNPLVCKNCDGTKSEIVEKIKAIYKDIALHRKRGLIGTQG